VGDAARVERIEVRWPDGSRDTMKNVAADRYVTITQSGNGTRAK
jgi:hypothetical protein